MSNMSYCRFENTLHDLQDCREHVGEKLYGRDGREIDARKSLIEEAIMLLEEVGLEVSVFDYPDGDVDRGHHAPAEGGVR